ncbi:alpha/beta hydrolase [Vineibacter terrae]|uniref:Alpha/beta hydrolase n=1 Tax=Vineibacter terrae TaxID=2586908 RepID=A0A5C8PMC9_9HYPH|nr:alpha/beta hydrolase [Vineibacter terrae]TXL74780.1 alpha/beta hydrolase [Vineibacter terrae]
MRGRWPGLAAGAAITLMLVAGAVLYTPDIPVETLKSRYASPRSQFIDIDGAAIHVRDEGSRRGPTLILLHGSNGSLQVWEPWARRLADSARLVSLDLPGHGLTGPWPRGDYSIPAYADLVVQIADRLDIPRFVAVGHSMGGAVAWTLAARHRQRVTHLVLIDTAAYPRDGAPPLSLRLAQAPVLGEIVTMLKPRWLAARTLRETYADPDKLDPADVRRYHDLLRRDGNRAATLQRLRHATRLDPAPLKSLALPTLILWGAQDRWVPAADARRLQHDIADSTLLVYPDAAHVPMEEVPDRSAADIRRFVLK